MYHSALKNETETKWIDRFENDGIKAFVWNVIDGFPKESNVCDVVYSEPAWQSGYSIFKERAKLHSTEYIDYLKAISNNIKDKPFWLLTGKHAFKYLPKPHNKLNTSIHSYGCYLLGWNDINMYPDKIDHWDFIKLLAKNYNLVYDFSCGYGNTGRIFIENGKACVLSDINGKCISIIKDWYENI
jgi:hypothetical protein